MRSKLPALAVSAIAMSCAPWVTTAQAQTPTESMRFLIPATGLVPNLGPKPDITSNGTAITAFNVGARPARATVWAFKGSETRRRIGGVQSIAPGSGVTFWDTQRSHADFYVLVADAPVMASGVVRVNNSIQERLPDTDRTRLPGYVFVQRGGEIYEGSVMQWGSQQVVTLFPQPIACENAPQGHFACSQGLATFGAAGDIVAPNPADSAPGSEPPPAGSGDGSGKKNPFAPAKPSSKPKK